MTNVTHAWNFLHGWVRRILYNEGGEEKMIYFKKWRWKVQVEVLGFCTLR
jgi:hypothetical protein